VPTSMLPINRVEPFTALADVYRRAGFATYSEALAPRLIDIAFDFDWTGRTLLDLACGTGDATCWFAEHGFRTVGVDLSGAMLRAAMQRAAQTSGIEAQFVTGDIRSFKPETQYEMVTCLGGSLNYLPALRDVEILFRVAHAALHPGKLFYFDLRTVRGLAHESGDRIAFDNGADVLIVNRNSFNYESLTLTSLYTIMRYASSVQGWQRAEETHHLRGYPIQAITKLIGQTGFKLRRTLTSSLEPADDNPDADLLVFVATREG
jgi:SAM-dependent methyltransferase